MYEGSFLRNTLAVVVGYNITDAIKRNESFPGDPAFNRQLLYIPRHTAFGSVSLLWGRMDLRLSHAVMGRRFTAEDHVSSLPEHHTTDVRMSGRFDIASTRCIASIEVRNIFDRSYQVFRDYPMPGRVIRAGIGVDY
jgi:outer membrane cobalamin receptor